MSGSFVHGTDGELWVAASGGFEDSSADVEVWWMLSGV